MRAPRPFGDGDTLDDRLERLDAEVLLPGHGDPWTGGVTQAVTHARGDPTVARRR